MTGAFDGAGKFALETGADASDARRKDLTARGEEALEKLDVFVVDRQRSIRFEGACFTFGTTETTVGLNNAKSSA